jgi:hypothetical protein
VWSGKIGNELMQKILNAEQIGTFHHNFFVQQQVEHFKEIALNRVEADKVVVDIGGGCGYFASAIYTELNLPTRVIDMDPGSVDSAKMLGVEAMVGDALRPVKKNDEGVVCFNQILHHLIANSEAKTLMLQMSAITAWHENNVKIFVNEYIYDSWIANTSGWLIYQITKSKLLSAIGRIVATVVPSMKANTFGVGVRFRSNREWKSIFEKCGFVIVGEKKGANESIALPLRLLFIKEIRRDSFFLVVK